MSNTIISKEINMSNTIRIKRRASGEPGAPASLRNAELAFNEVDDILYYGKGSGGADGTATTVEAIGGKGTFVTKSTDQTITGNKTFSGEVNVETPTSDSHAATKAYVDGAAATAADSSASAVQSNLDDHEADTDNPHSVTKAQVGLGNVDNTSDANKPISAATQAALDLKAPLASPALTGTPTAPTPEGGTNTTALATTAFVQAAIAALIDSAPGALDTLNELAASIGDDADFAATVTNALATKLTAANNLSDLADAATARSNLGLGSMALQSAASVAITGGSIDGITFDGGTF